MPTDYLHKVVVKVNDTTDGGKLAPNFLNPPEPNRTGPNRTDPDRTEPIRTEPDRTDQDRTEPFRTEPIQTSYKINKIKNKIKKKRKKIKKRKKERRLIRIQKKRNSYQAPKNGKVKSIQSFNNRNKSVMRATKILINSLMIITTNNLKLMRMHCNLIKLSIIRIFS